MELEKQDQLLAEPSKQEINVLAVLSFVFSIFSLSFIFIFITVWVARVNLDNDSVFFEIITPFAIVSFFLSIILSIISFVMGLFGRRNERYKSLSLTGVYISLISLIATILSMIIIVTVLY